MNPPALSVAEAMVGTALRVVTFKAQAWARRSLSYRAHIPETPGPPSPRVKGLNGQRMERLT